MQSDHQQRPLGYNIGPRSPNTNQGAYRQILTYAYSVFYIRTAHIVMQGVEGEREHLPRLTCDSSGCRLSRSVAVTHMGILVAGLTAVGIPSSASKWFTSTTMLMDKELACATHCKDALSRYLCPSIPM